MTSEPVPDRRLTEAQDQLLAYRAQLQAVAPAAMRAYRDMQKIADALEDLPPRMQRAVFRRTRLTAPAVRTNAERIIDTLSVHGLLRTAEGISTHEIP